MIEIDGSQGEGGGQIVRSSLALSLVTGRAITINNIRAGRSKPGLMRQHVTAVKEARKISGAKLVGAEIGATRLTFKPGKVEAGEYRFSITTAGSATLVLQTVLPALMIAESGSSLTLEGGTHNPYAPPFDFLKSAYLPLLERIGPAVEATLHRPGFYPAGGGEFHIKIRPTRQLQWLSLLERGELVERRVQAIVANLPAHIAERECDAIAAETNWDRSCFQTTSYEHSRGPGNVVLIVLRHENVTEVFTGFGEKGKKAELVAMDVLDQARRYLAHDAPVGQYLADQLMLPLAISAHFGCGGGVYRTASLSGHSQTHLDVIREFLDVRVRIDEVGNNQFDLQIKA
jgi:RNA 3'-terminal phosphate cyclase (ATP)